MNIQSSFTDYELMIEAINSSENIAQILSYLGLPKTGSLYKKLKKWAADNEIILPVQTKFNHVIKKPLTEILVENSSYCNGPLKKRLLSELNWKYECNMQNCPNPKPIWNNKPLSLHLDHINGISNDNRIKNLRFLCPNCHTQTETFGSKNSIKKSLNILCDCGRRRSKGTKFCIICTNKNKLGERTKIDWPELEILLQMLKESNYRQVSIKLNVADNSIRKHLERRGIDYKTLSPHKEN